jgi:lipopolysaccharide export system permease protein
LLNRNISLENLKTEGLEIPAKLIEAKSILKDFKDYSKTSLVSFTIGGILLILHFVFRNNKLPELAEASLSLSIISFIFLAIYAVVSAIVYSKFYKTINEKQKRINPIWFFITLPLYPLKYIFLKNRIEQHFYLSCINNIK